jgi:hypothetical protein
VSFEVEASSGLFLPDGRPVGVMNMSEVSTGVIAGDRSVRELAGQLGQWMEQARAKGPDASMFNRSLYITPDNPYAKMRLARNAVLEDNIVGAVADATEALAFDGGLKWESSNIDDADVFNQLSGDLNLDAKIRQMWREEFTVDQFICAKLWDTVEYTVRGSTEKGNKKKKKYKVYVPTRLVLLKPENVVPIGFGPLREDNLAWQATQNEIGTWADSMALERPIDPLMTTFFTGRYVPASDEAVEMGAWGVNIERLLAMNPDWVFRHCNTRPDYLKHPDLRLQGVFQLLDLKRQLIASDRATLIGAANYILLIRKGSDAAPATQEEVNNLKAGYNFLAKLPVIISDHRLEIDVIAPKVDFVLKPDAYDALDTRILHRTLQTFGAPGRTSTDATSTFSDVMASSIQSRRHMIKRTLEQEIGRAIVEHPKNKDVFEGRPSLVFTPRTVAIGTNQAVLTALLALRTQREISRDTILEYMGLDQATEAQRLEVEDAFYDDIFKTQIPFSAAGPNAPAPTGPTGPSGAPAAKKAAPAASGASGASGAAKKSAATPNGTAESPKVSGARGGRPTGGGNSAASPAKTAAPKTGNGNPSTKKD